ncbi:MAG: GTP 3',8-cyclase MoaA [bacterium]|nr:GTP 3',8-cyclase MoaA [bacterium]
MRPPVDGHGRPIDYLRISVTDRCNLRCVYCMPPGGVPLVGHGDILRYEELLRVIGAARRLGFRRFRITGGEPLVRRGLLPFLHRLTEAGVPYSMTTNGLLLGRFAGELARAGLARVNVGLDSLRPETFRRITGRDGLEEVLRGIEAARREGIGRIKVNVVVMRGMNEGEVDGFIEWGRRERLDVRFIEFMPVYGEDRYVSLAPWVEALRRDPALAPEADEGGGPAVRFRYLRGEGSVGFILPRSEPFCGGCNRLRLTADGTLLPCLFSTDGVGLRDPLRRGEAIGPLIEEAVRAKPAGHAFRMRLGRYAMHALGG